MSLKKACIFPEVDRLNSRLILNKVFSITCEIQHAKLEKL